MANMDQIDPAAGFANTERARGGSEPLTCTRSDLNDLRYQSEQIWWPKWARMVEVP
jgi:hypothetical protein